MNKITYIQLLIGLVAVVFLPHRAEAQQSNFSMYQYAPFFTNPGAIGAEEDVRVMVNYRNQRLDVDASYTFSSLSFYYPLYIGNHRLVLGADVMNDKVTNYLTTNGGLIAAAYNLQVSRHGSLSLGLQGGYMFQKTTSNYITDDQYVNGAFDASIVSSDAALTSATNYATVSAGLYYRLTDESGATRAFLGGSMFNANRPNTSATGNKDGTLPVTAKITGGYRVYDNGKLSIMPTARLVSYAGNSFANAGAQLGYALQSGEAGGKKLGLSAWYNTNKFGVFSLAYEQPTFTVAVSYDQPVVGGMGNGQNGIVELALSLRLKKRSRPARTASATPQPSVPEPTPTATQKQPAEETRAPEPQPATPQPEPQAPAQVTPQAAVFTPAEQKLLARTVRFKTNEDELEGDSRIFLDSVVAVLRTKETYTIELVGHTSSPGSEHFNQKLSEARAAAVRQYLVNAGLDPSHFITTGKGEREPLNDNSTPQEQAINRRVAFTLRQTSR